MLQLSEGAIRESLPATEMSMTVVGSASQYVPSITGGTATIGYVEPWQYTTYWNSYPVYVCTDKTKKAIEVLKALQAEKILKCDSVPRFIALVEKISALL